MNARVLRKIIPFGVLWAVFGLLYIFIEKGLLGDATIYPSTGNPYSFKGAIITVPSFSLIMGFAFGAIEYLFLRNLFAKRSFLLKILFKSSLYLLFIFLFLVLLTLVGNSLALNLPVIHPQVLQSVLTFLGTLSFWSVVFYIGIMIDISLFVIEVTDHLGSQVVKNYLIGKYHQPIQEERVFLFLDMKSSTTIAEKLGHVRYFELLKAYYSAMSQAIIKNEGEVYQYVGDEIIISWELKHGIRNNHCLNCFFDIKAAFNAKSTWFQEQYGVVPSFRAGLHCGQVTTGEIGELKKDIMFSGDVLNTAARLQAGCKDFDVDYLVSKDLLNLLTPANELTSFDIQAMGEVALRGKEEKVTLFTVIKA